MNVPGRLSFYGSVGLQYLAQYTKARLAYRADFWAGLLSDLIYQAANLLFIVIVFSQVPLLRGWSREEIIFIYGYFLLPYSLFNATAANLWDFPDRYIVKGEMDRVLTRPLHSLFQVLLETVDLEAFLGAVTGTGLLVWSAWQLQLDLRWYDLPVLLVMVLGSAAVYLGIYVALAAVAFWTDARTGLVPLMWNLNSYGRYPVEIYRGWLRFLLTWVLPLAFAGFYPAAWFLRRESWGTFAALTPLVGGLVLFLGIRIWNSGVSRYRGAGS